MKQAKTALNIAAILCATFGLILFIAPGILKSVGVEFNSKAGAIVLRSFFGGLQLGLSVFFALAARRPDWIKVALAGLVFSLGGLLFLRGFALLIAGFQANFLIYLTWLGESALFVYSFLTLLQYEDE